MPKRDAEFWEKTRRARDKLEKQYMHYDDVINIDIGIVPEQGETKEAILLRIHVTEHWMQARPQDRISFPAIIDEITVVVIPGDQAVLE